MSWRLRVRSCSMTIESISWGEKQILVTHITGSCLLISLPKVKEVEMGGCWWFRYCCKCGSWWSQRGSHHPWYNCRGLIYNSCRKSGLSSFHRGLDFETRLRDTHANAPRFNFLRDSSGEYHKYYQRSLAYYSTENTS